MKPFFLRTIAAQSHLLGCFAAIAGLIVLLQLALKKPDPIHFWACLLFGVTSILVFAASATYHFASDGFRSSPKVEQWLEDLDHFAIYLFIAGTYTPFLINAVAAPWSTILLVVIWSVGLLGILYSHFKPRLPAWAQHRVVYTGIFVLMGWTLVVRLGEVLKHLSLHSSILLVAGGLSYSIGALIYAFKRPKLFEGIFGFHELWHVMVIMGFGFHYFLILGFYK